ncbi:hypothetical protein HAX54_012690 [Datura stramonium]|uniref:Uncharacterized protein n=1 Tax=Datura stramonium TaxID=4076 RepID=A0ABS8TLY4_DATST|nr:hypothetical protein [Datura stramonium]
MNPSKKSEMRSSSKNSKHTFLPPGALARGPEQSFRSMGSVRVNAEKRTLINQFKVMQETQRSKPAYDLSELANKTNLLPPNFDPTKDDVTFPHDEYEVVNNTLKRKSAIGSDVQRTSIEKSKGYSATNSDTNKLAQNKSLIQSNFDRVEDDTSFPHEDLEVMQETLGSTPGSDIQRTSIEKSKGYSATNSDKNELAQNNSLIQSDFDRVEDDTSFPHEDLKVMQETLKEAHQDKGKA